MTFIAPKKLLITSDDSEIELLKIIPKTEKKSENYLYKFTKSITKENTTFEMTEDQLKHNLKNFFKEIE